jgi:hypothetical protein
VEVKVKNITLAIDEALLERARQLAANRKTTLNALVRSLLASEVEQDDRIAWAREGMRGLMDKHADDSGPAYQWNRQDAYADREDRMLSRHEHSGLRGFGEKS